jgi:hypothetical protein
MPNMLSMGTAVYHAEPSAGGWYAIPFTFSMTGVNQLLIQVQTTGNWEMVRTLLYDVDGVGRATLLTNTP